MKFTFGPLFYPGHGFRTTRRTAGNKIVGEPHSKLELKLDTYMVANFVGMARKWDVIRLLWILLRLRASRRNASSIVLNMLAPLVSAKESVQCRPRQSFRV
jgi:hypothetical protein